MFCTQCGKEISDQAVFCVSCGARQETAVPQMAPVTEAPRAQQSAPYTAPVTEQPAKKGRSAGATVLIVLAVLIGVFAVAAGVIFAVPPVRERVLPLIGMETPFSRGDADRDDADRDDGEEPARELSREAAKELDSIAEDAKDICEDIAKKMDKGDYIGGCLLMLDDDFLDVTDRLDELGEDVPLLVETSYGRLGIYPVEPVGEYEGEFHYMVYFGDYEDDVREGEGVWAVGYLLDGAETVEYTVGEWENDAPNGSQVTEGQVEGRGTYVYTGNMVDGLWHGPVTWDLRGWEPEYNIWLLNFSYGVPIAEYSYFDTDGSTVYVLAQYNIDGDAGWYTESEISVGGSYGFVTEELSEGGKIALDMNAIYGFVGNSWIHIPSGTYGSQEEIRELFLENPVIISRMCYSFTPYEWTYQEREIEGHYTTYYLLSDEIDTSEFDKRLSDWLDLEFDYRNLPETSWALGTCYMEGGVHLYLGLTGWAGSGYVTVEYRETYEENGSYVVNYQLMDNKGFDEPGYDYENPDNNRLDAGYIKIYLTPADNDIGYEITGYERVYYGFIDRTSGQQIVK